GVLFSLAIAAASRTYNPCAIQLSSDSEECTWIPSTISPALITAWYVPLIPLERLTELTASDSFAGVSNFSVIYPRAGCDVFGKLSERVTFSSNSAAHSSNSFRY